MKAIRIENCKQCPFYKEMRDTRNGEFVGISICKVQDNKEIEQTDVIYIPSVYYKVHESCKLDDYFE